MKTVRLALPAAVTAVLVLASSALLAQEPSAGPPAPDGDGRREQPAEKKSPPVSAGSDGFTLQSENGEFRLQLRAYVQFDARFFPGDESARGVDTFLLRRVRPILQGALGRYFDFKIMPDFGGGTSTLQDAWLDFKPSPALRVRLGKDKSPVGLERLQSATALTFVERAFPTLIVPNRDVGVQLRGELGGGIVAYAAGVFDGAPDGGSVDRDLDDSKDLEGRIFVSPFKKGKSALRDLGFGIAGTTGSESGPLTVFRSTGQAAIVTPRDGVSADGTRRRFSPQLSFYRGPFGLVAEYARSASWAKTADGVRAKLVAGAWQATASFALTGDRASYAGAVPRRPFDPDRGQWGALEIAARVHCLELDRQGFESGLLDPAISVRRAFAWAVGLNWILTRNVKQVVDFERATFRGGAASGGDRGPETTLLIRTQLSF
jgi:phosphate-selective porin OprO and OprP